MCESVLHDFSLNSQIYYICMYPCVGQCIDNIGRQVYYSGDSVYPFNVAHCFVFFKLVS